MKKIILILAFSLLIIFYGCNSIKIESIDPFTNADTVYQQDTNKMFNIKKEAYYVLPYSE